MIKLERIGSLSERVARGVELLDRETPRWRERIDVETLDMHSVYRCIIGQVFCVGYNVGLEMLGATGKGSYCGFDLLPGEYNKVDKWNELRDLWIRAISE